MRQPQATKAPRLSVKKRPIGLHYQCRGLEHGPYPAAFVEAIGELRKARDAGSCAGRLRFVPSATKCATDLLREHESSRSLHSRRPINFGTEANAERLHHAENSAQAWITSRGEGLV